MGLTPPLIAFANRYVKGVSTINAQGAFDKLGTPAPAGHYWPNGLDGFACQYSVDAHCVAYHVEGSPFACRLTKRVARGLPNIALGWVLVDVDNARHSAWVDPWSVDMGGVVERAVDVVGARCGWYLTRCGYRLLWPLRKPVPIADAERLLVGVVRGLRAKGIDVDERCTDWTRLFRLPFVTRDGVLQQFPADLVR